MIRRRGDLRVCPQPTTAAASERGGSHACRGDSAGAGEAMRAWRRVARGGMAGVHGVRVGAAGRGGDPYRDQRCRCRQRQPARGAHAGACLQRRVQHDLVCAGARRPDHQPHHVHQSGRQRRARRGGDPPVRAGGVFHQWRQEHPHRCHAPARAWRHDRARERRAASVPPVRRRWRQRVVAARGDVARWPCQGRRCRSWRRGARCRWRDLQPRYREHRGQHAGRQHRAGRRRAFRIERDRWRRRRRCGGRQRWGQSQWWHPVGAGRLGRRRPHPERPTAVRRRRRRSGRARFDRLQRWHRWFRRRRRWRPDAGWRRIRWRCGLRQWRWIRRRHGRCDLQ